MDYELIAESFPKLIGGIDETLMLAEPIALRSQLLIALLEGRVR